MGPVPGSGCLGWTVWGVPRVSLLTSSVRTRLQRCSNEKRVFVLRGFSGDGGSVRVGWKSPPVQIDPNPCLVFGESGLVGSLDPSKGRTTTLDSR